MSNRPEDERCRDCRWWGGVDGAERGVCRAGRPVSDGRGSCSWPVTGGSDWCREWEGKVERRVRE